MQGYFNWLSSETGSEWNNDSAVSAQVEHAVSQGAIGATTNPPLSYEALTTDTQAYGDALAALDHTLPDDDFALAAMSLVVKRHAAYFLPLHEEKGGLFGCVRAQVAPNLRSDSDGMLRMGKRLAALGTNVMVKIPGTKAGMKTLEELAALGIPTNPTVVTTVAQAIAAAEAFDRGCERAMKAGLVPAWSSCAVVMGRAQDYFSALNQQRGLGLSDEELAWAALAIVKRSYRIFRERGYRSAVMPAAFRAALQVEQLAGGAFHSTIHPKIQQVVEAADAAGEIRRELLADAPVNQSAIDRVAAVLPEFTQAYEPDGLEPDQFDTCGSVVMTLDGFDRDGWQKLISLK